MTELASPLERNVNMEAKLKEQLRQGIAEAVWRHDRAKKITPCDGEPFHPIAMPGFALSLDYNSLHYGGLADAVIDAIEPIIDSLVDKGRKEVVEWLLADDDMPLADEYKYPPKTVAQIKAKLKEWGLLRQEMPK